MSYQVLARKYRPKNFDSLVGQEHVVRALTHALEQKRLHHAYLFTGTRGVGKTTLSRILAKSLNCQGADGNGDITAQPCGQCEACVAIDAGRFVDYIEMDAASNRGVDEMAQLLEQAIYAPSNARFKVYMIDEVHMLTSHAFNAMLKTLEEPPEHVKFILATTDPQKIPVTVLSRCLQFNLKQMPPGHIVSHLENILGQEQIAFDPPALRLLAQGAQGSMRDALSLTDQAIAYAAGKVTLDAVQGMLGALDHTYLVQLLDALAAQDGAALLAVADEMASRSLSWSAALQDLGTLLNRVAIAQTVPSAVPDDLPEREEILRLAGLFSPEDVQLNYQIVVHGRHELGLAPDEYAGFTMTLLRMLAFAPAASAAGEPAARPAAARTASAALQAARPAAASVAAAPAQATRASAGPAASAAASASASASAHSAHATPAGSAASSPASSRVEHGAPDDFDAFGLSTPVAAATQADMPAAAATPPAAAPAASGRPVSPAMAALAAARSSKAKAAPPPPPSDDDFFGADASTVDDGDPAQKKTESRAQLSPPEPSAQAIDWPALMKTLPLRGVPQQLAMQSELLAFNEAGNVVSIKLRVPVDTLLTAGSADKLAAALETHYGKPVRMDTEIGATQRTAHAADVAEQAERQRQAEQTLQEDPFVQSLMREFGATIVPGSIRPV